MSLNPEKHRLSEEEHTCLLGLGTWGHLGRKFRVLGTWTIMRGRDPFIIECRCTERASEVLNAGQKLQAEAEMMTSDQLYQLAGGKIPQGRCQ